MGPISGADETLVTYAAQLRAAGHTVSVLLVYPHADDEHYCVRLREAGVPLHSVASKSAGASMSAGRSLALRLMRACPPARTLLRRNSQRVATGMAARYYEQCRDYLARCGADLIHVLTPDPNAMIMIRAAHAAGVPAIYQELGTPYHPPEFEAYYEQFTSVLPLCSEVAALSPRLARQCAERLATPTRPSVLPIMVNAPRRAAARRNGSPRDGLTFGFASRIERLKGPLLLVEAFAAVGREHEGVRLKMAGAGSLKQQAVSMAEELGVARRCDFPGVYTSPEDRSAFMQSLDVFVLPSQTEGTPNCVVEAMAHGLPVVASAVGGIPDVVTPETGLLFPEGDGAALSAAMGQLAADRGLRERMGAAGRERYERLFSPRAVLPLMLETYRRVAGGDGGGAARAPGGAHPWRHPPRGRVEG